MAALSGSALTQADAFAGFHNLSASAQTKGSNYSFFGQMPFGISEIKDAGVAFLQRLGTGVMGAVWHSYGNSGFTRQQLNVGYAIPLSPQFSASASFAYSSTHIGNGYGKAATLWAKVGASYVVRKDWQWAMVADVPTKSVVNGEELPASIRIGTTYSFGTQVNLFGQVSSTSSRTSSVNYSFGMEYLPSEYLSLRAGMNTLEQSWSLGFGTKLKNYRMDVSASVHPQLGVTPQISLTYGVEN